jgi:hypothetical protein
VLFTKGKDLAWESTTPALEAPRVATRALEPIANDKGLQIKDKDRTREIVQDK